MKMTKDSNSYEQGENKFQNKEESTKKDEKALKSNLDKKDGFINSFYYAFMIKLLIMIDFLCPILSDISISIRTAYFNSYNRYNLLYYKNIGQP